MARKKVELHELQAVPVDAVLPDPEGGKPPPEQAVAELTRQAEQRHTLPPPLVRDEGRDGYSIVVGAGSLEAARRLHWEELDCIVVGGESDAELSVVRRIQAQDSDPWEVADALAALKQRYGWTQEQLGLAVGRNRDFVANMLAITQIAPEVRRAILRHDQGDELTARHLRYVARAPRAEQMRVAQRILGDTLTTKALEREKHDSSGGALQANLIRTRPLRLPGAANYPRSTKEWRRYQRQLMTDLRRVGKREAEELRRAQTTINEARQRLKLVKTEASRKRRQLQRELRTVKKQLLRLGS